MLPTSREASAAGRLRPNALVVTGLASLRTEIRKTLRR